MPEITIEKNCTINYSLQVHSQWGWLFDPMTFKMGIPGLGIVATKLIKPSGEIKMIVNGTITNASDSAIELGFVQFLTASQRVVTYTDDHQFIQKHARPYPIKDGKGKPWYKEGAGKTGKYHGKGAKASFRLEVTDEPRFSYPDRDQVAENITFVDHFVAYFAAKTNTAIYALHQVEWEMRVQVQTPNPRQNGGIRVLNERPVLAPHILPNKIILNGPAANDCTVSTYARVLK